MIFRLDLKIFIFFILFYFTKQIKIYAIILIFAIIHEISHLIVGILLKMKVKRITLMPFGLSIEFYEKINKNNNKKIEIIKIIIAITGPITSLLISIFAKFLIKDNELNQIITYSNFLIAIFNLLPIYPLDGGRILKSFLKIYTNKLDVDLYINTLSNMSLFFITFLFSILIYYLKNIAIIFILLDLWYIVLKENNAYRIRKKIYRILQIKNLKM